jgi:hypothetical protein
MNMARTTCFSTQAACHLADDRRTVSGLSASSRRVPTSAWARRDRLTAPSPWRCSNERSRAVKFQLKGVDCFEQSSLVKRGNTIVDYTAVFDDLLQRAQDRLSRCLADSVALEFKDEMSQAVMSPIGAEGYTYTYVIMPMRV